MSHDPCTVILSDQESARLQLVAEVLLQCDATGRRVDKVAELATLASSVRCFTAIVALATPLSPADRGLDAMRGLKHRGFTVISYGDGAHSWPLSARCRVLLAGASWLLDSATLDFAQELRQTLLQLFRVEAERWHGRERVKGTMRELGIVGDSDAMLSLFRSVLKISALSDLPILITGETGTGKQLIAQAIHALDPKRRVGPFVAVNCGAISPGLAESELFGHRRGAFTGADHERRGLIRTAHGGTLFLDEVGELDDALQTKLLRVLQENRVLGVGEDREVVVSVRVVAATNRDLAAMLAQGTFRADLFHRLSVLSLHAPPLRQRSADVKLLIEHFVRKNRLLNPTATPSVGPEFIEALSRVELPGNVRQLENLVRRALVNKEDDTPLTLSDLPLEIWQQLSGEEGGPANQPRRVASPEAPEGDLPGHLVTLLQSNGGSLSRSMRHCERSLLEAALHMAGGNQSQTARLLGITPRSVYNKVRKHQLHR